MLCNINDSRSYVESMRGIRAEIQRDEFRLWPSAQIHLDVAVEV